MIVFLPLSPFRVHYQVATGRPYSKLENLVMKAIYQGTSRPEELKDIFQVHPRLIIEALVTLTQAGWIAVGGNGSFVLTTVGRQAIRSGALPKSIMVVDRTSSVIMERLTGGLVTGTAVRFINEHEVKKHNGIRLHPEATDNNLDEGQVRNLLPCPGDAWIRWVGPIDMMSKGYHYLPVNVNLDANTVGGLPDIWFWSLKPLIFEEVMSLEEKYDKKHKKEFWPGLDRKPPERPRDADEEDEVIDRNQYRVKLNAEDFLLTAAQHEDYLLQSMTAHMNLFIASPTLDLRRLQQIEGALKTALGRGIYVDILSGSPIDPQVKEWLQVLGSHFRQQDGSGRLHFDHGKSGGTSMLLWDKPGTPGLFEACAGYNDWLGRDAEGVLSVPPNDGPYCCSLIVRHPQLIAELCSCVTGLWSRTPEGRLSAVGDRWWRMSDSLNQTVFTANNLAPPGENNARISLVFDREHCKIMSEWLGTSQYRLMFVGPILGDTVSRNLSFTSKKGRSEDFAFLIAYGRTEMDEVELGKLRSLVEQYQGHLVAVDHIRANVFISDASAYIGSHNFLSRAFVREDPAHSRNLGVIIEGPEIAEYLWKVYYENLDIG